MVGDKVEEAKWKGLCVWQQMKGIMMASAQDICGGPRRHRETWWWNEEVAEAVREKKIKYGKEKEENTKEARMEYKKSRKKCKKRLSLQQRKRNRRNVQMTRSVKMKFFEWQSRWSKKNRI